MRYALLLIALCFSGLSFGQDAITKQQDYDGVFGQTYDKVLQLAEAIPAEKYSWRPAEGVKSIGEALAHTSVGNYFFASLYGAELPADLNIMTLEQTLTDKEDILAEFKRSSTLLREIALDFPDAEMMDKFTFPDGTELNKGKLYFISSGHLNEHLGQLIAYARMNGIAPPWSR